VAAVNMTDTPTIDDPDIFRAAKLLIDQHGDDASLRAAERADELLAEADVEGSAVWRRILAAIDELQRGALGKRKPALKGRDGCMACAAILIGSSAGLAWWLA
jgi:hypothetical protein